MSIEAQASNAHSRPICMIGISCSAHNFANQHHTTRPQRQHITTMSASIVDSTAAPMPPTLPFVARNILVDTSREKYGDDKTADVAFVVSYEPVKTGRLKSARLGPKEFIAHRFVFPKDGFFATVLDHCKTGDGAIPITGIEPDVFNILLQHCYGFVVDSEAIEPVCTQVINAADQFGILSLKAKAERLLIRNKTVTMANVMDLLSYADAKNLIHLKEHTMRFLLQHACMAHRTLSFANLPGHLIKDMLGAFLTRDMPLLPETDCDATTPEFYHDALAKYNDESTADVVFKVYEPNVIDLFEDDDDDMSRYSTWETTNEDAGRGSTQFFAHRFVLPKRSKLFESAVSQDGLDPIPIHGVKPNVFGILLYYLYGGPIQVDVMRINAKDIAGAAARFGLAQLRVEAEASAFAWTPKAGYASDDLTSPLVTPVSMGAQHIDTAADDDSADTSLFGEDDHTDSHHSLRNMIRRTIRAEVNNYFLEHEDQLLGGVNV